MLKKIIQPLGYDQEVLFKTNEIEKAIPISQNQLNDAKLFTSKYEYAKTLNKNISYLEVGVAWGYSAQMFIDTTNAKSADLVDVYNNCDGVVAAGGPAPKDSLLTHEEYIKSKFSYHPNVNIIKGDARDIVPTLNKKYDLILLDMERERFFIRNLLSICSKITNVDGIIGLTSYIIYDGIFYNELHHEKVGVFQSVNEFLHLNKNWSVDAMVLNDLGYHDIYIKRKS
jgi:predicted O-methyltransferase YrrM